MRVQGVALWQSANKRHYNSMWRTTPHHAVTNQCSSKLAVDVIMVCYRLFDISLLFQF